jgi:uncharacterized RDD family membrane protein YckC
VSARLDDQVEPSLIGHYAGAATRLVAIIIDVALALAIFDLALIGLSWLVEVFTPWSLNRDSTWVALPLIGWLFLYFWYCYTLSGKTPGMAFLGLRVVRGDGSTLDGRHAAIRVITLPWGMFVLGLGYLGIVFGRRRRAWQDMLADTAVVYDFDARAARLRFLVRKPIKADPAGTATH